VDGGREQLSDLDRARLQRAHRDGTTEVRGLDLLEDDPVDALQADRAILVRGAVGGCAEDERTGDGLPSPTAGRGAAPTRPPARRPGWAPRWAPVAGPAARSRRTGTPPARRLRRRLPASAWPRP